MKIEDLDKRMFELLKELQSRGVLKYKRDFCNACGLPEQNLSNIKKEVNHFNLIHVHNICEFYNLDSNWIIRKTDNLFMRQHSTQNSTQTKVKCASV